MSQKPLFYPIPLPSEQEKQPWAGDLFALQAVWFFPVLESGLTSSWDQSLLVLRLVPNRALVRGLMMGALCTDGAGTPAPKLEKMWGVTLSLNWAQIAVHEVLNATCLDFDSSSPPQAHELTRGQTVTLSQTQTEGLVSLGNTLLGPKGPLGEVLRGALGPLLPEHLRPQVDSQGLSKALARSTERIVGYRNLFPGSLPILYTDDHNVTYCLEDYYPWGRSQREAVALIVKQDTTLGQMVKHGILKWDWSRKKVIGELPPGDVGPEEWMARFSQNLHTPLADMLTARGRWLADLSKTGVGGIR